MGSIEEFFTLNNLQYYDENQQIAFENHLCELKKRIANNQMLDYELTTEIKSQYTDQILELAQKFLSYITDDIDKVDEREIYLLALYFQLMEVKCEQ